MLKMIKFRLFAYNSYTVRASRNPEAIELGYMTKYEKL